MGGTEFRWEAKPTWCELALDGRAIRGGDEEVLEAQPHEPSRTRMLMVDWVKLSGLKVKKLYAPSNLGPCSAAHVYA